MATTNPTAIAANFAALMYTARHHPDAEGELAEAARVLRCALGDTPLVVRPTTGWLDLNGVRIPDASPGAGDVREQLMVHGLGHLETPERASPDDLIAVACSLAAYPGAYPDLQAFLLSLGEARHRIRVSPAVGELSLLNFDESLPPITLNESGAAPGDLRVIHDAFAEMGLPDDPGVPPPPLETVRDDAAVPPAVAREASPGPGDAHRLHQLVHDARSADDAGDMIALLGVARSFLDAADAAGTQVTARAYRHEFRRILSRRHLGQFAKLAAIGKHKEMAVDVLRRLGAEATEVLMELLVESDSMPERRGLFTALTRMAEGTDIIAHHLDHPAWYVVRNAAELCGELRLEGSLSGLARAARHADERVRKSVVTALVKIGAREGLEPMARLLKDPAPAIRLQVLGALDAHWGRPLAMSLAALLETEDHPEVVRETLRALGRIGTPDALQALHRAAAGENPRLARRQRLQAIEALGLAGPPAAGILRGLARGGDREVTEGATKVLEAIPA